MPLDIVIFGPPGAGKGTQAKRIATDVGIPHVATGDMLRAAMEAGTELGRTVKETYDRGDLVSDQLMIQLIRERLSQPDTVDGFVLDGFPRTLAQAEALDQMLEEIERGELAIVLNFMVGDDVVQERIIGRARAEHRSDDTPEKVQHRLDVFHAETEKLVAHYRAKGILVGIHAEGTIDEVFAEIQNVLQTTAAR